MRRGRIADDEEGSTLLLTLGYALLAIAVVLVCVNASSLYLAQKRLDALADSAALAGADGFRVEMAEAGPQALLTDTGVREQAAAVVEVTGDAAELVEAGTPDGRSARVTVAGSWHPVMFSFLVPDGVPLQSTATTRTALN